MKVRVSEGEGENECGNIDEDSENGDMMVACSIENIYLYL